MTGGKEVEQATPGGVKVFGSATVRVSADRASIQFSVTRTAKTPSEAFRSTREAATAVSGYLAKKNLHDVRSSRITLTQEFRHNRGDRELIGYCARLGYHLMMGELTAVEETIIGVVDSGANLIESVDFTTSKLKEHRADARRAAMASAREKADLYVAAAGAKLGAVRAILDANPDRIQGRRESYGHAAPSPMIDPATGPVDPGAVAVSGAVWVVYAIE